MPQVAADVSDGGDTSMVAGGEGAGRAGVAVTVACAAWFICATVLAAEVLEVEPRRGNLWIVILIYVAPVLMFVVGRELVLRIKNGPRSPGRHRSDQ